MNTRILRTNPLLGVRGDLAVADIPTPSQLTLDTFITLQATQTADALQRLEAIPDNILTHRLSTCLDITAPTCVLLTTTTHPITRIPCVDGTIIVLPTQIQSFVHIARTRPLPPHEQQRRIALLTHPQLSTCIELAAQHGHVSRAQIAQHLQMTTTAATTLLKHLAPVFCPTDHSAKHFVYDAIAHRAIISYHAEETLPNTVNDARQQLPEVVRRYSNHLGKIHQLPVRMSDRTIVLRYLAQQLPATPMTEPQINAAILAHVAFDDYATARRDMVDLGFVMRTANGSMYQRICDTSN